MATEIATAFVSLVPSFKGGQAAITRELSGAVKPASDRAGEQAGQGILGGIKGIAGAAGAAIIGLIAVDKIKEVFGSALEQGAQTAELGASLGLNDAQTAKAGKLTGQIYASNFGESLEQVNEAAVLVSRNIGTSFNDANFRPITEKVLNLSSVFKQDLGGTTAAVGQLIKTGLAKDANEAIDLLTRGFQTGTDKAGDLLDTVTEYSTQFRKLGIDGPQALSLMNQGLVAGARDADIVADAFKEFSIRAVDGSDATALGFKQVGLNAKTMAKAIGAGGKTANEALDLTMDRLRAIPDPVKRAQAAYNLFGTQSEDLGAALFALDPSKATNALKDVGGAAQRMGDQIGGTPKARLDTFTRGLKQGLTDAAGTAIGGIANLGTKIQDVFSGAGGFDRVQGVLDRIGSAFTALGPPLKEFGAAILPVLKDLGTQIMNVVGPALDDIGKIITEQLIPAAKEFLPAFEPVAKFLIGVIGGAVVGALKGVVNIVKGVLTIVSGLLEVFTGLFTGDWSKMWEGIKTIASGIWKVIKGAFSVFINVGMGKLFKLAGGLFAKLAKGAWTKVSGAFRTGIDAAKGLAKRGLDSVVSFFTGLPGRAVRALASLGKSLLGVFTRAMTTGTKGITDGITKLIKTVKGIPGRIVKALGNVGRTLYSAGRKIIQGLIDGITDMIGRLRDKLGDITGMIPDLKGPPRKDALLLRSNGRLILGGLITGIQDQAPELRSTLQGITTSIPGQFGTHIGADSPELVAPEVRVFIGDRELTHIVRTEVSETNRATRTRVMTGAGRGL